METPAANTLVSDHIIKALCNTLMHSLWQGILLAIITGAIIIFTKKASAAYRYNLLVGALALFAGGVLFTFMWQLQQVQPGHASTVYHVNATAKLPISYQVNTTATPPVAAQMAAPVVVQNTKESITQTVLNYFNSHYNIIVLIWFLIICAKSIQMAVGLHGVYYLKRNKVFTVGEHWENRLLQLARLLRIKQTIRLMESGIAKVPMVIGHLKPVILIPIGLINSLPADAVEAILVHELAHIRRRDYLVNLLQSFMEIVFFFNPAVLWLSQLIKAERENCCDDMALAQSSNKENYIRALVSCEEYKAAGSAYAMAFPGGKNSLLARVKRMIGNRNHSLNMVEKTMLAICLVVLGLGVSAFTVREQITKTIHSVMAAIRHESKVEPKQQAAAVRGDTTKKKPAAPVNDANSLLNQLRQTSPDTLLLTGNSQFNLVNHNLDSLLKLNGTLAGLPGNSGFNANPYLSQLAKADSNQLAKLMTARLNSQLSLEKPDTNILRSLKQSQDIGRELYRERLITDTNHLSITTHLDKRELIVNGVRMPDDVFQRIYTKFYKKDDKGNYGSNTNRNNRFESDGDKTQRIISDMLKDGIIANTNDLSFKIGTTEFVVNYKKQPEGIYRKYRAEYVDGQHSGHNDWIWFYKFDTKKWDLMTAHRYNGDNDHTDNSTTGVFQGKEDANSGYNKNGYNGTSGAYSGNGKYYNRWDAYSDSLRNERNRVEAERDKKLIADLLQDDLITDPNNVTFSISDKGLKINGKKQSDGIYQKYKEKYEPDSFGTWSWNYSHHE